MSGGGKGGKEGGISPRGSGVATENRPGNKVRGKEVVVYLDTVVYSRPDQNFILANWPKCR